LKKDGKMDTRKKPLNGAPLQKDNFELYMFESDQPISLGEQHLSAPVVSKAHVQNCFTPELVGNICKLNKLCTLDDMFAMGLQGNLIELNKISAIAVPLHRFGSSLGFILIYRSSEDKLTPRELNNISAVTCGLSRAVQSCQMLLHTAAHPLTPAGAGDGEGIASSCD
jgi:hypothetical protein